MAIGACLAVLISIDMLFAPSRSRVRLVPRAAGGSVRHPNHRGAGARLPEFTPAQIEVEAGETVRFVESNPGSVEHEFVLGDEDVQMAHEGEMNMGWRTARSRAICLR